MSTGEVKCYLCGGTSHHRRRGRVRDAEDMEILECNGCGLVFLSGNRPASDFYKQSGMHGENLQPVDLWLRDAHRDDERRYRDLKAAMTNRNVLDFGCGAGGFLIKARTVANRVVGIELEERLQPHYREKGLEVVRAVGDISSHEYFDLITAFHVMEHLEDPAGMLRLFVKKLRDKGRVIVEVPSSADALLTLYESISFSEFTYWSCHLYLFNASTLEILAKMAGLKVDYISHIQRYPISNHLYWLARGLPGGHEVWSFLDSDELSRAYEARLASLGKTDTLLASFSI